MRAFYILLAALSFSTSLEASDAVPKGAKKLAVSTLAQLIELEPYALTGKGLLDADAMTYFRKFVNPLQATIDQYPSFGDPAARAWGDAGYCKDAASALLSLGMGQNAKTNNDAKAGPWYQKQRNNCANFVKSFSRG